MTDQNTAPVSDASTTTSGEATRNGRQQTLTLVRADMLLDLGKKALEALAKCRQYGNVTDSAIDTFGDAAVEMLFDPSRFATFAEKRYDVKHAESVAQEYESRGQTDLARVTMDEVKDFRRILDGSERALNDKLEHISEARMRLVRAEAYAATVVANPEAEANRAAEAERLARLARLSANRQTVPSGNVRPQPRFSPTPTPRSQQASAAPSAPKMPPVDRVALAIQTNFAWNDRFNEANAQKPRNEQKPPKVDQNALIRALNWAWEQGIPEADAVAGAKKACKDYRGANEEQATAKVASAMDVIKNPPKPQQAQASGDSAEQPSASAKQPQPQRPAPRKQNQAKGRPDPANGGNATDAEVKAFKANVAETPAAKPVTLGEVILHKQQTAADAS